MTESASWDMIIDAFDEAKVALYSVSILHALCAVLSIIQEGEECYRACRVQCVEHQYSTVQSTVHYCTAVQYYIECSGTWDRR
jgi:hypothetical protein